MFLNFLISSPIKQRERFVHKTVISIKLQAQSLAHDGEIQETLAIF